MYNDLIGKKFQYGGRGPDIFDCYGLCMEIYRRFGIVLPDHPTSFGNVLLDDGTYQQGKSDFVRLEKPEPFCLATFMVFRPYVSHIGVVLENCSSFINVERKRNVCIEKLDSTRWAKRLDGFWKYEKN